MSEFSQNISLNTFSASYSDLNTNTKGRQGKVIPEKTLSSLLSSFLRQMVKLQNTYLQEFSKLEYMDSILSMGTKPAQKEREMFIRLAQVPTEWKSSIHLTRSCISEVISKLKGYFKRVQIAELLEKNPEISYREAQKHIPYLKFQLFENVKHAMAYPQVPHVSIPKIYLGMTSNTKAYFVAGGIFVSRAYLKEYTVDLFFPLSENILKQYPKAVKVGVPTIRTNKDGDVFFDFKITSVVAKAKAKENILGIDPKMYNGFAGALVKRDGNVSKEISPSQEVFRDEKKKKRLKTDLKRKIKRLENIKKNSPEGEKKDQRIAILEKEIAGIRAKINHINVHQDWNSANDLVLFAKNEGARIALEDVRFNKGDNHWRNRMFCDKVEHIAKKYSVSVEMTSPKDTSTTCPQCGGKLDEKDLSERTSHCSHCGLELDRDYCAGIVHAEKAGATPKNFNKPKHKKQITKKNQKKQTSKRSDKIKWRGLYRAPSALGNAVKLTGCYKVRTRPQRFVRNCEFSSTNTFLAFRGLP